MLLIVLLVTAATLVIGWLAGGARGGMLSDIAHHVVELVEHVLDLIRRGPPSR